MNEQTDVEEKTMPDHFWADVKHVIEPREDSVKDRFWDLGE